MRLKRLVDPRGRRGAPWRLRMPANEPRAQRTDSVRECEHLGHLVFADEPVAKEPLEMARRLPTLAPRLREPLPLLLRRIPIGPLGNERLSRQRRPQQLI